MVWSDLWDVLKQPLNKAPIPQLRQIAEKKQFSQLNATSTPGTIHSAWCNVESFLGKKNNYRWDIIAFLSHQYWKWYNAEGIWRWSAEETVIQSVILCVALWRIFQRNGMFEFTGRTGSILPEWDAIKAGSSEPFICHVTEHNHLFPEICVSVGHHKMEIRHVSLTIRTLC